MRLLAWSSSRNWALHVAAVSAAPFWWMSMWWSFRSPNRRCGGWNNPFWYIEFSVLQRTQLFLSTLLGQCFYHFLCMFQITCFSHFWDLIPFDLAVTWIFQEFRLQKTVVISARWTPWTSKKPRWNFNIPASTVRWLLRVEGRRAKRPRQGPFLVKYAEREGGGWRWKGWYNLGT